MRFDSSGYSKDHKRPLPIGKIKKVMDMMKNDISGKIKTEFAALRVKMYANRKLDIICSTAANAEPQSNLSKKDKSM